MKVVNLINRTLPKTPENQKEKNGILINAFLFKNDVMDCAVGGNINAYQYNFPDKPKIYRFINSKPNFEFKIQNRNVIDEEEDGTPIWGSIEWVNPTVKWRPLDIKKTNYIFPNNHSFIKEWLQIIYLNEIYWIPPNTEFRVDPETNFIVGRKVVVDEEGDVVFEGVQWEVMKSERPIDHNTILVEN